MEDVDRSRFEYAEFVFQLRSAGFHDAAQILLQKCDVVVWLWTIWIPLSSTAKDFFWFGLVCVFAVISWLTW